MLYVWNKYVYNPYKRRKYGAVYIYIYIHTHIHTHTHIYIYIHTHTYIYIYIYIYIHTHTHIYIYIYIFHRVILLPSRKYPSKFIINLTHARNQRYETEIWMCHVSSKGLPVFFIQCSFNPKRNINALRGQMKTFLIIEKVVHIFTFVS